MNLIKKSIFILKNYGIKAFIKKAIKFPINKINLLKQKKAEKKAKKYQWKTIFNHPTNFRLYPQFLLTLFPRLYKKTYF